MHLSQDDRARVHAALAEAGAKTGARFAAVIVPATDHYALYPLLWGAMGAFLTGAALALFKPELSLRLGVVFEAIAFVAVAMGLDWFPIRLRAVPARIKHARASAMARREFAARILAGGHDGVLFFVALGERHVEIVASEAVHARVGEGAWQAIVARFTAAAAQGRIVAAVQEAIEACAGHLAQHFPKTP
jgi:putative membrane protein